VPRFPQLVDLQGLVGKTFLFHSSAFASFGVGRMAKNTGDGYRRGAVTGRTQFQREDGNYQKRNERNGQFMEVKGRGKPFKGVAKEPDGRDGSD